jgi:hypothetical protein
MTEQQAVATLMMMGWERFNVSAEPPRDLDLPGTPWWLDWCDTEDGIALAHSNEKRVSQWFDTWQECVDYCVAEKLEAVDEAM